MGLWRQVQLRALRVEESLETVAVAPAAFVYSRIRSDTAISGTAALADTFGSMVIAVVVTAPWFVPFACAVWGIRAVFRTSEVR